MNEEPVISEELQGLLNVAFGPELYEIEKGMVLKFTEAIGDPNPRWRQIAPPTLPAALVPQELFNRVVAARCPLTRVLNGSSEIEYRQPIKIGDVISVTGKLVNLRKLEGKTGRTLFLILEITYENQRGELVATGRNTLIRL